MVKKDVRNGIGGSLPSKSRKKRADDTIGDLPSCWGGPLRKGELREHS